MTINPTESLIMTVNEMSASIGGNFCNINENMFKAAVDAMHMHGKSYGYPTLLCGNFVTSIGPASTAECPINQGRVPFDDYHKALETCKKNFVEPSWSDYETVLLGKMSDEGGWYLPFIYLDGYVDIHGRDSVAKALGELLAIDGEVDTFLCKRLQWFTDLCRNIETGEISCTKKFDNKDIIIDNVKNHKSLLMFSFSEILATLTKATGYDRKSYALTSVSMGPENNLLQFTDGLVVSRSQWDSKQVAISEFIKFFTSTSFRYKLAYGFDLNRPQIRYLLMPNKDFYDKTPAQYDPIYSDAFPLLQRAVPAPPLSKQDRKDIQDLLNKKCITPSMGAKANPKYKAPGRKTEL